MEILSQIEEACKNNRSTDVMNLLDSVESGELKRQTFLTIINYYEQEEGRFPIGYSILFLEWLLQNGDLDTAKDYIVKLNQLGIEKEQISELIFEYIIKPNEAAYRERFNKNIALLEKNKILFKKQTFDFEQIKKNILIVSNYQIDTKNETREKEQWPTFLLVDVINLDQLKRLLGKGHLIYLVYEDLRKFYFLLLFEDLVQISQYCQEKKIIFFAGKDLDSLRSFFDSIMVPHPNYCVDFSVHKDSHRIIKGIKELKSQRLKSYIEELKVYYKNKDYHYYKNLFHKEPSGIKVLLVTSIHTDLNQFIVKSWYQAFIELGYTAKLLIENEPYEQVTNSSIWEQLYEFRPDVVFQINHAADILNAEEVRKSLLWIMRYRDTANISLEQPGYDYNNMFILPALMDWPEELVDIGIPENRILYTLEGIDISVFAKKENINKQYACDIVTVNNSAGNELFRLKFYLKRLKEGKLQGIIHELYAQMEEMAPNDEFIYTDSDFLKLLDEKLTGKGIQITDAGEKYFLWFYWALVNSFYRRRVMEWIVDAKITKNIKVWGSGWSKLEKFKDFSMGIARHGEELSDIYRSSKISLCDTLVWNTHERNFEILSSGGFPLVKSIERDPQKKVDCMTNYFKENEEIVLFYNKDDLLNKVQYYLDNPQERERIAENGRNVVIRDFSNTAVAERTMDFIKNYYSDETNVDQEK